MRNNCLDVLKITGGIAADSHIHLHTSTPEPAYIRSCLHAAKHMGIERVGFVAHGPRLSPKHTSILNSIDDLQSFRAAIDAVNDGGMAGIYVGIELDYSVPGDFRDHTLSLLKESMELDFVIGSIHHYRFSEYRDYVNAVLDLMEIYPMDILGHLDISEETVNWKGYLDSIFRCAGEHGIAVELNGNINRCLSEKILDAMCCNCVKYAVPFTYGSDAHRAEDVGMNKDYLNRYAMAVQP